MHMSIDIELGIVIKEIIFSCRQFCAKMSYESSSHTLLRLQGKMCRGNTRANDAQARTMYIVPLLSLAAAREWLTADLRLVPFFLLLLAFALPSDAASFDTGELQVISGSNPRGLSQSLSGSVSVFSSLARFRSLTESTSHTAAPPILATSSSIYVGFVLSTCTPDALHWRTQPHTEHKQ